ncbi:MAG: response regulator [Verrucomicrobiaceae bacterium]|nr:MAG: response regulator [Verrucomicrobiaceae bacterium]
MNPFRILIISDEGGAGKDVQQSLIRLGYIEPQIAKNEQDPTEIVRRTDPDLVVMDIQIDGLVDAMLLAKEIRYDFGKPIIFLTDLADEKTIKRAGEIDPEAYLLKPFDENELKSSVAIAMSRNRSREALINREKQLFSTLSSMADALIATDIVGNITYMNPVAESLTGWEFGDAKHMVLQDVLSIKDPSGNKVPALAPGYRSKNKSKRTSYLTRKGGGRVLIEDNAAPLKDPQGSLVGLVVVFREAMDEDSREPDPDQIADDPIRNIVEGIADPLFTVDKNWEITFVNQRAVELFDALDKGIIGNKFWRMFSEDVREENIHGVSRAMTRGERAAFEFYHQDSSSWFELNAYPFGGGLLLLMRDITERIEENESALRLEKLESLSLLARGFAHDFNNILTVILGNLSLANVKLPKGVEGDEEIENALSATLRAQNRVQQLLTFAKGGSPIRQTINFGKVISEILEEHDCDDQIQYIVESPENIWKVDADPGQFRRVVENLLRNAEQAMPGGGKIVISLMNVGANDFSKGNLPPSLELEEGLDYVILQVIDDGHGIDDDLVDKVFEPYFTSRTQANATGIGLTVCESIARAHDGGIILEPNLPSGTRAVVSFPASTDNEATFEKVSLIDQRKSLSSILILEDDSLIRQLLVANLEREGYEVTETEDGVDTVARYIERYRAGNPYDLVIMDLSVPKGMGGVRAIKEILNIDSEVKAIVSSGYSDDPVMANPKSFGFSGVLPKPYQPDELISLVSGILK